MRCVIKVEPDSNPEAGTIISQQFPYGLDCADHTNSEAEAQSRILGAYSLIERIGAGGMGQVYKAVHCGSGRVVAIKTLPASTQHNSSVLARFEREARLATRLVHPNIIAAYEADEFNGTRFLVMQYIAGQDLSAAVKANGPLSVPQAINYIQQAARGLEFAHAAGVVHRDIKPGNLLLDHDGVIKILDLGLARLESQDEVNAQAELTETGTVMGTIDYMAPEQAMSARNADARADIYSLGCSLYYLLTGRPIYEGDSLTAKLIAHQFHPIPDLRQQCPAIPAELEAIFRRMVAKQADERYQSMAEVIADIERVMLEQVTSERSDATLPAVTPNPTPTLSLQAASTVKSGGFDCTADLLRLARSAKPRGFVPAEQTMTLPPHARMSQVSAPKHPEVASRQSRERSPNGDGLDQELFANVPARQLAMHSVERLRRPSIARLDALALRE